MKRYQAIWMDDEFKELNIIKEKASLAGIQLIGFDNAEEGIGELKKNMNQYDAAVVDGNFRLFPNQQGGVNDQAFGHVAKELFAADRSFPWFILSGQMNFTKESNKFAAVFKDGKVYDKNNDRKTFFNYAMNIFLRTFCDYGTNPLKAINIAFYVLLGAMHNLAFINKTTILLFFT